MGRPLQNGFTLIETLVVICIIGVLTFVIFPNYHQRKEHSKAAQLADSFRAYATALKDIAEINGSQLDQSQTDKLPDVMKSQIPQLHEESIVGGEWQWSCDEAIEKIEIRLVNHEAAMGLIERVDHLLDDGDLKTGIVTGDEDQLTMVLRR